MVSYGIFLSLSDLLSMRIPRSTHEAANGIVSFYSIVYMYCIFLTHSSIGGDLGGFHVLAIVKSAVMWVVPFLNSGLGKKFIFPEELEYIFILIMKIVCLAMSSSPLWLEESSELNHLTEATWCLKRKETPRQVGLNLNLRLKDLGWLIETQVSSSIKQD